MNKIKNENKAFALSNLTLFNSDESKKQSAMAIEILIIPKNNEVPIMPSFGTKIKGKRIYANKAPI